LDWTGEELSQSEKRDIYREQGTKWRQHGKRLMGAGLEIRRLQVQVAFWPLAGAVLGPSPL